MCELKDSLIIPPTDIALTDQLSKVMKAGMVRGMPSSMALLYRGSRDGFTAQAFHSACDNKGPTLTVIRATNGAVLGGYSHAPWTSQGAYVSQGYGNAWLFSLKTPNRSSPILLDLPIGGCCNQYTLKCGSCGTQGPAPALCQCGSPQTSCQICGYGLAGWCCSPPLASKSSGRVC